MAVMLRALCLLPAALAVMVPAAAGTVQGGALPEIDWGARGGVDWASGHVLAYGTGAPSPTLGNPNLRRAEARRIAFRDATRNLFRLCLDLTVREKVTVRDYLRDDPELQASLRKKLSSIAPWSIRLLPGENVQAAVLLPLGGPGGLSEILDTLEEWGGGSTVAGGYSRGRENSPEERVSGVILLSSGKLLTPALRPRIVGEAGRVLASFESVSGQARSRPAFVPYYSSLNDALQDPELGPDPMVVAADQGSGPGTDIVIPPYVEEKLLATGTGRRILDELRIAVVIQ